MTTVTSRVQAADSSSGRDRERRILSHAWRWVIGPVTTILVTSFIVFAALTLTPGDPVTQILGGKASAEQRAHLREQLGLDDPLIVRYADWLGGILTGDLGTSYTYKDAVGTVLLPRIETTVSLVLYAGILILIVGIALGLVGGLSTRIKPAIVVLVAVLISIPSYVAATALLGVFAVNLRLFPTYGAGTPGPDRIWHLTLPAIALSIAWIAYMAQISMAAVSEQRANEHVRTAEGRGLPRSLVIRKHILRNAGIPIVTASGLTLAALVAGSVVVESAFTIDGVGSLLVRSVSSKDVPVVAAISVLIVAIFVVMMTLVELIHVAIDPAARRGGRTK
ncbi:ABC transporter permease [Microbacterium sp. E-13]|uniref:ABC transporter permease n=1 Tax=Microbacterium sp. E-13 TaxID=3404048 RepID=UPI003CE9810B